MTNVRTGDAELLTLSEVAATIRVPVATLRWWRAQGRGPKMFLIGRHVVARRSDVEAFVDAQSANAVGI